jgi:hypothetical protein
MLTISVADPDPEHPKEIYRVAAINPEFFSSYFQMTQHS